MARRLRAVLAALSLAAFAAATSAQNAPAPQNAAPATTLPDASASPSVQAAPYTPNASASPNASFPSTSEMLENIGKIIKDGHLSIEADLIQGSMPVMPKYTLNVDGSPKASVAVEAVDGKVTHMKFGVGNGQLAVRGSGLRPKVAIESMEFQDPKGITDL